MNAITLLSGWSQHQHHQQQHRRASLSRVEQHDSSSGISHDDKEQEEGVIQQDSQSQTYIYGHSPYEHATSPIGGGASDSAVHDASSTSIKRQDIASLLLKPPEAVAYEQLEVEQQQQQQQAHQSDDHAPIIPALSPSFDPASLYPTPDPSRSPTPTNNNAEEGGIGGVGDADITAGASSMGSLQPVLDPTSSTFSIADNPSDQTTVGRLKSYSWPSQSHDEAVSHPHPQAPSQRRLSDKQTRALARSFPVRCIARIYILLRRFFALFGVQLDQLTSPPSLTAPIPAAAITPSHEKEESIAHEEAPPSYIHATQQQPNTMSDKALNKVNEKQPLKSRFGNLLGRVKSSSNTTPATTDNEPTSTNEGYASTSSDEWTLSEEKKLLKKRDATSQHPVNGTSGKAIQIPARMRSGPTRASIAELALSKPKLLVLDLDETLIHSTSRMSYASNAVTSTVDPSSRSAWNANTSGLKVRVVEVVLDGRSVIYQVYKRPWVDFFLRKVSSWYTVVVFTASLQEYADPVIDWLDQGRGMISSRLFRESCTYVNGSYVKDLSIVDKDLARVCLVDNSPISYAINQPNGIPIEGWINDPNDEALLDLLPMLDSLRFTNDVRHILALRLAATSTAQLSAAAKARRRRFTSAAGSGSASASGMGSDTSEQAAAQRAVAAHQKAE